MSASKWPARACYSLLTWAGTMRFAAVLPTAAIEPVASTKTNGSGLLAVDV